MYYSGVIVLIVSPTEETGATRNVSGIFVTSTPSHVQHYPARMVMPAASFGARANIPLPPTFQRSYSVSARKKLSQQHSTKKKHCISKHGAVGKACVFSFSPHVKGGPTT